MAEMTSGSINDLPDSDFAYIEKGGTKDSEGKTTPRSLRHFPIHDAAHVRNALARLSSSPFEAKARPKVEAAAKKMGIGEPAESKKASSAAMEASQGAGILEDLYCLISCEADEPDQLGILQQAATLVARWIDMERGEIGGPGDEEYAGDYADMGKASHRALSEIKAEPMDTSQMDSWLSGKIPRRMLAIPFGGPIPAPNAPRGVDLDGEWFSEATDLYAGHKALLATRERMMDFHHGNDPLKVMGDGREYITLGKAIIDLKPEEEGWWVDFWADAGEKRLALIAKLEAKGAKLYGSSQAAAGWRKNKATGEITVWPWIRQTVSTSPQNTLAVMPPLKALLTDESLPFDGAGLAALKAALVGFEDLSTDLRATSRGGERAAKSRRLSTVLDEAERTLGRLRARAEQSQGVPVQ